MLFSSDPWRSPLGLRRQASKAYVEWLLHCDTADFQANVEAIERSGVMSLFDPEPAPTIEQIERSIGDEAHQYLLRHLPELLSDPRSVRLVDDVQAVFGRMLGRAGPPAVRRVVKELHGDALVDNDGRGDFHLRSISWTGPSDF